MSVRRLILLACLLCLLAPAAAIAQANKPVRDFNTADMNKDGKVTLDELIAHTGYKPEKAKKVMQKYDKDSRGFLMPQEFDAWKAEETFQDNEAY